VVVVVVAWDVVVMVVLMLSGFPGERITNFNNRPIAIVKIMKTTKEMQTVLAQR
jgi:hypothetical protein